MSHSTQEAKHDRALDIELADMTGDYISLYRIAREIKKEGEDEYADAVLQLAIRNHNQNIRQREREEIADRMGDEDDYQQERDTYYAEAQYAPAEGPERDYYYA